MTTPANRILQGLNEALGHARNEASDMRVHVPDSIDVGAVRRRVGLTQAAFSRTIGVSTATLRNWEQGRRAPEGPARVLLALLARNPHIVEQTLSRGV